MEIEVKCDDCGLINTVDLADDFVCIQCSWTQGEPMDVISDE